MPIYDTAIIGGGASGLSAAISAARAGASCVILERLPRVGKKLLSTGNGRCNFTNTNIDRSRYRGSCTSLLPAAEKIDVSGLMRGLGVYGAADDEGRVYPLSGSASAVLDALRLGAKKLGVTEICEFEAADIKKEKNFSISSEAGAISARSVIIAGGGMSQSALGSNGSAIRLIKKLGIKTAPLHPALVPLKTDPAAVKGLKGVRASASASLVKNSKIFKTERGEVQFGENALSGICIFDLSLWYDEGENAEILLDLVPDMSADELYGALISLKEIRSEAQPEDLLTGLIHKRLGLLVMRELAKKPIPELSENDLKQLAHRIKNVSFPILSTAGFERSQVTRGGVLAEELNAGFGARGIPGLYICGEALDIAGECGGLNLAFAFASGLIAGKAAAEGLK